MDFTLNLQAAAAFLNAAAGAAGGTAGSDPLAGDVRDGASFSEILAQTSGAAQTEETAEQGEVQTEGAEGAAAGDVVSEESAVDENGMIYLPKTTLEDIIDIINNSDNGIKKGLRLLFETMVKAFTNENSRDKKTDLFSMFYGSGDGLFDDDTFLLGAELMYQFGTAMDMELVSGTDEDDITDVLDQLLNSLFSKDDDEESDENTAADILASLVSPEVQDELVYLVEPEEELAPVQITAELFKLPKEIVIEEKPQDVPKMERLFEEVKVEIQVKPDEEPDIQDTVQDIRSMMEATRSAVNVNDATDQIRIISDEKIPETAVVQTEEQQDEDAATVQAELASAVQNTVPAENTSEVKPAEADAVTVRSVEHQITEQITEKLIDIKGDNGTEEMVVVLKPENLGQVAVKLIKENGALSVVLSAQYDEVGRMMTDRAAALSDSLTNRNVEVKSIEVVDPSNAAEQMGLNFTNQGFSFSRGQEYSSDDEKNSYRGIDEIDEITETEHEIQIVKEATRWQILA